MFFSSFILQTTYVLETRMLPFLKYPALNLTSGFPGSPGLVGLNGLPGSKGQSGVPGKLIG